MQQMPQRLSCQGNCHGFGDQPFSGFSSNPGGLVGFLPDCPFDADGRDTLARLGRLIFLLVSPIYNHLRATRRTWSELDGCRITFPFYMATSLEADRVAQPTISTTVSSES